MAIMRHGTEAVQCHGYRSRVALSGFQPRTAETSFVSLNKLLKKQNYLFLAVFGISCSTQCPRARGFLVPRPGIKLMPLHWDHRVLTTGSP